MIVNILFTFLLFLIYSHSLHETNCYEIIIRIILFGVSIKYFYEFDDLETFKPQCYPGSDPVGPYNSFLNDSKSWCKDNIDSMDIGDQSSNPFNSDNSDSKNSNECAYGKEATPLEAIESDSKSWCKESEL